MFGGRRWTGSPVFTAFALGCLIATPPAAAQEASAPASPQGEVGDNAAALPGFVDVTIPDVGPDRFAAALSGGYGYIEPIRAGDGDHHRLSGTIGLSLRLFEYFSAWFRMDGRYDMHPDDGDGADESIVGSPRFGIRGGYEIIDGLRVGADFGLWLPGADAPDVDPDGVGFTVLALASYRPEGTGLTLGLNLGYRFDQSGNTVGDPTRLRSGDQISLGVSDFTHAIPFGVGASLREDMIEGLVELRWDFLLDGPDAIQSPAQISAGARLHPWEGLQIELLARVSVSERIDPASGVLVPIEPRFAVMLGARYAFVFGEPSAQEDEDEVDTDPDPSEVPTTGSIEGRVTDADGAPVAGVMVRAEHAGRDDQPPWSSETSTDDTGAFTIADAPVGPVTVTATAGEQTPQEQAIEVRSEESTRVELELAAIVARGELRGLIRDFRGRPVSATIRVEPVGEEVAVDEEGVFEVELPVGSYEVVISAPRFREQRRRVEVEENGVTILNADLRRQR